MAVINGLNAVGSGNTLSMYGNSMSNLAAKSSTATPTTQASASKAVVLNASVADVKPTPGTLDIGEVVKVTNDTGKVEYFVGTANGGVSKPLTSVNSAVSQVTTEVKKAETIQKVALESANKIEILELKDELKAQGVPTKDINKIVAAETAANKADLKQFTSLLAEPNLQYGVRDTATNTFVNNVVNGVTTPVAPPKSLLTYNDPVVAPIVQANIKSANDAVAEFQLLHGITQPYEGKGNNQVGLDPVAIYQALDGNHIETVRDPITGAVTDYKFSDQVAKAKGDQSGLMNAIGGEAGFGKYEARALGQILSPNSLLGQPVAVSSDAKGNMYVNATTLDANGKPIAQTDAKGNPINRYADQNALVDTGQVDGQGNKIFAELATDNSKRNYVSVVNSYVQQPDGSFKFGGVSDMSYKHVPKMNVGDVLEKAATAAATIAAAYYTGPLLGLSGSAATAAGGAVSGALGAALTGSNVLKGALLGGVTGFGVGEIQAAAKAAGGYENLFSQVGTGDFSSFTQAGQDIAASAATSSVDGGSGGLLGGDNQASIDFGDGSVDLGGFTQGEIDYFNATGGLNEGADWLNKFNLDGTLKTIDLSNSNRYTDGTLRIGENLNPSNIDYIGNATDKFKLDNWSNDKSLIQNTLDQMYDPNIPTVINPDGSLKTIDLSNSNYNTDGTLRNTTTPTGGGTTGGGGGGGDGGGIFDGGTPTLTDTLVIGGGLLAADKLKDALTPKPPAETVYTSPLLIPGKAPMTQVPTFAQNYNNLFNRQGVGAGQFLGYDYLNRINVPPELMGLLGTSAQAMPSMTPTV